MYRVSVMGSGNGLVPDAASRRSVIAGSVVCCGADELKMASRAQMRKSRLVADQESFGQRRRRQFATGKLFEDPEFPATAASLFPNKDAKTGISGGGGVGSYEWKRPKEINPAPRFISKSISRFDIRQGELKDCWLLAAVASLSMHRRLLELVVPFDQGFDKEYCGMFRFRFWQFGEWKEVVIDDRLPTKSGKLCFMRSQQENEFWSALLEKAYAKLNGNYQALCGGNQAESMEDLTGGLCETFDLKQPPGDLLQILYQANRSHSLMGCCIESAVLEGILPNKLITSHAYSVTDVRQVPLTDGSRQWLVRVRNPWGNEYEWSGDWGDHSAMWDRVSPAEKQKLGLEVGDDGEFWMSFEDFSKEFTKLEVCRLSPDTMFEDVKSPASPKSKKKRHWEMCLETGEWVANISAGGCRNFIASFHTNPQFRVEIVAPDEEESAENLGTIIVGLMQKGVRKRSGGGHFHSIGYCIYNLKNKDSGTLDQAFFRTNRFVTKSMFGDLREVCSRHKLPPGHYVIVPSTFNPNEEAQFILRIFSEKPNRTETMDNCSCISCGQGVMTASGDGNRMSAMPTPAKTDPTDQLYKAFLNFSGSTRKIGSRQLQQVLNVTYGKEIKNFRGFSLDTCRSVLALVDVDMCGSMNFEEFKMLWGQVRQLRKVFKEFDAENVGQFDAFKLREALKQAGLNVSNKVYHAVATRYTDREKGLVMFEDFVLLCIRLRIAFESFNAMPKCDDQGAVGMVNHDNYLEQAIYS